MDREERDDQLRRVAEARVEEAADAGARVLGRVLGRLADQPRERDERRAREQEEQHLVRVRHVVDEDRHGREGEQRPEDPASQSAGSVSGRARGCLVRLGRHAHALGARTRPARGGARGRASPRSGASRCPALTERFRDGVPVGVLRAGHRSRRSSTRRRCGGCSASSRSRSRDDELARFLEAEHAAWAPARQLATTTHALLEALRERGLEARARLERVRPAGAPAPRSRAARHRRAPRRRRSSPRRWGGASPIPEIFRRALDALGVEPARGPVRRRHARDATSPARRRSACTPARRSGSGPTTTPDAPEPDFQAFTQMDVLTIARRLQVVSGDSVCASTNPATSQVLRDPESRAHNVCR